MRISYWFGLLALSFAPAVIGCSGGNTDKGKDSSAKAPRGASNEHAKADAEVQANLSKLSAEDRRLAETQQRCPISSEPLGSMGVPLKLTVEGQPVFLCCKACEKDALADAEKTLAKVKELKAKTASPNK